MLFLTIYVARTHLYTAPLSQCHRALSRPGAACCHRDDQSAGPFRIEPERHALQPALRTGGGAPCVPGVLRAALRPQLPCAKFLFFKVVGMVPRLKIRGENWAFAPPVLQLRHLGD